MADDSISSWIHELKAGNPEAAEALWQRYFRRLVGLARVRLQDLPKGAADEEDVALSAFATFCRGAEEGRFPLLADADNLWPLLVVLTVRKAADWKQREHRQKRGGGQQVFTLSDEEMKRIVGSEEDPQFAAEIAEECQHLLGRLSDSSLRSVALWKMEGFTNQEIAARLGCAPRTVERKLRAIRAIWEIEGDRL